MYLSLLLFLTGSLVILLLFVLGWGWALKYQFYSAVDVLWSWSIGLLGLFWMSSFMLLRGQFSLRTFIAALFLFFWSGRLGMHLYHRLKKKYPQEDPRYTTLREEWKGKEKRAFFFFFEAQALSVILLALPFFWIGAASNHPFSLLDGVGVAIAFSGIFGEFLADTQLLAFKKKHPSSAEVCQVGLWRYSRHPNYFFEIVLWWGFFFLATGVPFGWSSFYAPLGMTYLICCVTGLPPSEAAALARKGEKYKAYQQQTSPLIPWRPRLLISAESPPKPQT